jgi:hypothetical protein
MVRITRILSGKGIKKAHILICEILQLTSHVRIRKISKLYPQSQEADMDNQRNNIRILAQLHKRCSNFTFFKSEVCVSDEDGLVKAELITVWSIPFDV